MKQGALRATLPPNEHEQTVNCAFRTCNIWAMGFLSVPPNPSYIYTAIIRLPKNQITHRQPTANVMHAVTAKTCCARRGIIAP